MKLFEKNICYLNQDKLYTHRTQTDSDMDVILSPSYYWHFREKFPNVSMGKAKKIAPQILRSKLPEGNFEYFLFPTDKKNILDVIAFDKIAFTEKLNAFPIDKERIKHLSFAYTELPKHMLLSSKDTVIGQEEGIFFELDKNLFPEHETLESLERQLDSITELNFKLPFSRSNILEQIWDFTNDHAYQLSTIFTLLGISFLIQAIDSYTQTQKLRSLTQSLLENQKYAQHRVQLEYIQKEFEETDKTQSSFRDQFRKIVSHPVNANTYFHGIRYDDEGWVMEIKANNKQVADTLAARINGSYLSVQNQVYAYRVNP